MDTPGTVTRWFDIEAVQSSGARSLSSMRMLGVFLILGLCLPGFAYGMITEGVKPWIVIAVAIVVAVATVAGMALLILVQRSRRRTRAEAGVRRLGVGTTGLVCVIGEATRDIRWDDLGGVRIHSDTKGLYVGARTYVFSVDLLGPIPPQAANPALAALHSPVLSRIALAEGVGLDTQNAIGFAEQLAVAVRTFRPNKWRGFTHDPGVGGPEFQGWDRAIQGAFSPGYGSAPTTSNFGSRFRNPSGPGQGGPYR